MSDSQEKKTFFSEKRNLSEMRIFPPKMFFPENTFLHIFYQKHLFLLENFSAKDAIFADFDSSELKRVQKSFSRNLIKSNFLQQLYEIANAQPQSFFKKKFRD